MTPELWQKVRQRALHDPYVQALVYKVDHGDLTHDTLEDALGEAVLALSATRERLLDDVARCHALHGRYE